MKRTIPTVPPRSRRWVSEMEEIRDTFAHLGMTPHLFEGVAEMYRFIGSTPLGEEFPESRDPPPYFHRHHSPTRPVCTAAGGRRRPSDLIVTFGLRPRYREGTGHD